MNRDIYTWNVVIVDERSQSREVQFVAFWSPEWGEDGHAEREVAMAAAAMATVASRGQHKYAGLTATLVDATERTVGAPPGVGVS